MIQDEHDPQELLHALYPLAGGEANVAAAVRRGAKLTAQGRKPCRRFGAGGTAVHRGSQREQRQAAAGVDRTGIRRM